MGEKVGNDVLGSGSSLGHGGLTAQQRERLKKKMVEEKRRKATGDITELNGKEAPREAVPGEHPYEPKLGEQDLWDLDKTVVVKKHRRGAPQKGVNTYFERKAQEIREGK